MEFAWEKGYQCLEHEIYIMYSMIYLSMFLYIIVDDKMRDWAREFLYKYRNPKLNILGGLHGCIVIYCVTEGLNFVY